MAVYRRCRCQWGEWCCRCVVVAAAASAFICRCFGVLVRMIVAAAHSGILLMLVWVLAASAHGVSFPACLFRYRIAIKYPVAATGSSTKEIGMKIGELAKQTGCAVETIRYYEHEGLLPPATRNPANNYREYGAAHLERLVFIRRCRTLEMTRQEIRELLHARAEPNASCTTINSLIDEHITHVQARVAELNALEQQLIQLRRQCQAAHTNRDCGILRSLDHSVADGSAAPAQHHSGLAKPLA